MSTTNIVEYPRVLLLEILSPKSNKSLNLKYIQKLIYILNSICHWIWLYQEYEKIDEKQVPVFRNDNHRISAPN